MIETVLAVLVITFMFFALFNLSHLLTCKILVEHAAMRVARARAVGFNDFMCLKTARVAVIPVAGKRLWPTDDMSDKELNRISLYMGSRDAALANGLLDYENWHTMTVDAGDGGQSIVKLKTGWFKVEGKAGIEDGYTYYMEGSQ